MQGVFFTSLKTFLLDLLFPVECLGCGICGTYLCAGCFAKIPVQESFLCPVCGRPSFENAVCAACKKRTALDGLIAASFYDSALLRRLVFAYKYRFVKAIGEILAHLVIKGLSLHAYSLFYRVDALLLPVPLSSRRENWRGFNQAREISVILSPYLRFPVREGVLLRNRSTKPQTETTSRNERIENIRGAFTVAQPQEVKRKTIILIDDVATTLSTLNECARVLKAAGAKEVWGLVAAREYFKK